MEILKDIEDFEGLYKVSNLGRIYSIRNNKFLKATPNSLHTNRLYIKLYKDKKQYTFILARLVAKAFIPNPQHLTTVNHKDGNPLNNRIENLEWLSNADNIRHAYKTGLQKSGHRRSTAKYTKQEILNMYRMHDAGLSSNAIAAVYNGSGRSIRRILSGDRYKELYRQYRDNYNN